MTDDDKKYGKPTPYDPNFKGPLEKRSCTDILCLGLFFAFIIVWVALGIYAFVNGDPRRLVYPTDTNGRLCGIDEGVKNKPFLFFFDIRKCATPNVMLTGCPTPQICVETCPSNNFIYDTTFANTRAAPPSDQLFCNNNTCSSTLDPNLITECMNTYQCSRFYLESEPVADRCIPKIIVNLANTSEIEQLLNSTGTSFQEILESSKFTVALSSAIEVGHMVIQDLSSSWPWLVGGIVLAMLLSLIYIIILRWFAGIMVWISLLGVLGLLGYCVYATYDKYSSLERNPVSDQEREQMGTVDSFLALKDTWLVFLIASAVVLLIVLLLILFLRKRIIIAVALIKEASKAVGSITSSLIFPIFPWLFQCVVMAYFIVVLIFLASSSERVYMLTDISDDSTCNCTSQRCNPDNIAESMHCTDANNATCSPDPEPKCHFLRYETPNYVSYLHAYNVVGFFWGMFFVSGLGEMILAGVFATWYWTFNKSNVPFFAVTRSVFRTFRYHLGTVAFGSLILAICRIIRVILEYIDHKLKKYDNICIRAVLCCCKCFFWCLEKFIKFINRNAYIMCAVHGKNFCRSARKAFSLLMRNVVRVFVLDKVTDFLLFLGKLAITAGIVALAFFLFDGTIDIPHLQVPTFNYYLIPVILLGIATYLVTCVFFNVFSMAVDTLFLCFLEDCERNDGSREKPYYMSKNLMKILGKKNKKEKKNK